jgi:hypothetical protein
MNTGDEGITMNTGDKDGLHGTPDDRRFLCISEQAVMLLIYDAELERNNAKLARIYREVAALQHESKIIHKRQAALIDVIQQVKGSTT